MDSSYKNREAKLFIRQCSTLVGAASVPIFFVPNADFVALASTWTKMMTYISELHEVRFSEKPEAFIGSIIAGLAAYKTGGIVITVGATALLTAVSGGLFLLLGTGGIVLSNALLNAFFTWKLGNNMNRMFSEKRRLCVGAEATKILIKSFIKDLCYVPSMAEIKEFWQDTGLTFGEVKSWLKNR